MTIKGFGRLVCAGLVAGPILGMMAARACTSIVVSRGASKDGSVMVTYSADAPFMPRLLRVPGGRIRPARWSRSGAGRTTRSAAR